METVLITGSSRGIGAACARLFAKNGYKVAINYFKNRELAEILRSEIIANDGVAEIFYADVSKIDDVECMSDEVNTKFGPPTILINNAGISDQKLFTDITLEDWNNIFNCNVKSVFICCSKFIPNMLNNKYGRIINISSIWGVVGGSCEVHYSAAKAAIIGFSKALSNEVALSGITVNCIAPGVIQTDMISSYNLDDLKTLKQQIPCGRLGKPSDIAAAVLFLASKDASYITGQIINIGGGFLA